MVLVTGASGFLGQHLMRHLSAHGYKVRGLYNNHPPRKQLQELPGTEWVKCDLLDIYAVEEVMQDVGEVYHCAAIVSYNPAQREDMIHFNTESTANIVNQALEQSIKKMVYVSSVAAIGRSGNNKEITEEEVWEESTYSSAYGLSKHLGEMEVWRGIGEGLNAVIINPGIILGEGNWDEGSARLMKVVYNEFPFYTQGITAWVDVEDVVRVMELLMLSDVNDERFIISAGNYAYKDIFTQMAAALNRKPPGIKAGRFLTGVVWRITMLKTRLFNTPATITKETAHNAQQLSYFNNGKFPLFFPSFAYTPVDQSISRIAKAFIKEGIKKYFFVISKNICNLAL